MRSLKQELEARTRPSMWGSMSTSANSNSNLQQQPIRSIQDRHIERDQTRQESGLFRETFSEIRLGIVSENGDALLRNHAANHPRFRCEDVLGTHGT